MPIAVVMIPNGVVPFILAHDTADLLLAGLRTLSCAPDLQDITLARNWLESLGELSGWFDHMRDLQAHLELAFVGRSPELPLGTITGWSLLELLI